MAGEIKTEPGGQKVVDFSGDSEPKDVKPKVLPKSKRDALLPKPPSLESRLAEFFGTVNQAPDGFVYYDGIAGLTSMIDVRDSALIAGHGPTMAKAWADLADESPRVRRFLEMMLTGGAWGGVFVATAPVIIGIMANHNLLPEGGLFGGAVATDEEEDASGLQDRGASEQPGAAPRGAAGTRSSVG